jgi:GNAT superfamily N-acetyltransferase
MIPDGYTELAPGKIASVVTYLEMPNRPAQSGVSPGGVLLRQVKTPDLDWYRTQYRRAGEQWLWFSRLEMTDEQLVAVLHNSNTGIFLAECNGREIGIAELDRAQSPNVEIVSFGLFREAIGKGLGRSFMSLLLDQVWSATTERVWLHTCNLDSPTALTFYMKCGFRPYKRAIEVADDPRIRGILPEDVAPNVPIIR